MVFSFVESSWDLYHKPAAGSLAVFSLDSYSFTLRVYLSHL